MQYRVLHRDCSIGFPAELAARCSHASCPGRRRIEQLTTTVCPYVDVQRLLFISLSLSPRLPPLFLPDHCVFFFPFFYVLIFFVLLHYVSSTLLLLQQLLIAVLVAATVTDFVLFLLPPSLRSRRAPQPL